MNDRGGSKLRADHVGEHRVAFEKARAVILKTQEICGICGQPVDKSYRYPHPLSPTVDHIIPISKGGHPSAMENLQLAHRYCNRVKSDKLWGKRVEEDVETEAVMNDLPQHYDWKNYRASSKPGGVTP